jgi:HD-like signal output (HDOD) protein/HPt (histidine-containing phosphotransfer) domain-containing protein
MEEEYYWEIYEMFKEQIQEQIPSVETNILALNDDLKVSDAIDDIFRAYHSYKATSQFLSLKQMTEHTIKAETILSALREEKRTVPETVIDWLLKSVDQMHIWLDEMHKNKVELSEVSKELKGRVRLSKLEISPKDKLKELTVLYIDKNKKRIEKVEPFLKKFVGVVKSESETELAKDLIKSYKHDILIINLDSDNHDLIDLSKQVYLNRPILAIFDSIDLSCKMKLLKTGTSHVITNPLNPKVFHRELIYITKIYFSSQNIIINNETILEFIRNLKPLPNTLFQIMQICDDEELPIKDLIKVIKSDPIISASILKASNSPYYGSTQIKTIDQAVTKLGKRAIKALSMSGLSKKLGEVDLSPYAIDENTFSEVSMKRLSLMLKWYSKVSIADLTILSSTALLGNLGQILISREIIKMNEVDKFKTLCESFCIRQAEEKVIHTTTTLITSQILNYWKLSSDIVDTIAYSDAPNEAPIELKRFIVANNIVYRLVDLTGNILDEIPNDVLLLLDENNLDPAPLQKALESIQSIY